MLRGPVHWDLAGYLIALEHGSADAAFTRRVLDAYRWNQAEDLEPFTAAHKLYDEIWRTYVWARYERG